MASTSSHLPSTRRETRKTVSLYSSRTKLQLPRFSKMVLRVFNVLFITAVLMGMQAEAIIKPGGLSEEKLVTPEVQAVIDSVRTDVARQLGRCLCLFKGLTYKTQVVAGLNYFVKVDIGKEDVVHIKVYYAIPSGTHTLSGIQTNIPRNQPISHF